MRGTAKLIVAVVAAVVAMVPLCGVAALAQGPAYKLGKTANPEEVHAWENAPMVGPEGKELPHGSGTAKEGAKVWTERCAKCHGADGKFEWPLRAHMPSAGKAPQLAGDHGIIIGKQFATTVWDEINRSMPLGEEARTLSADQVYAVTAYLLYMDRIVKETEVMDAQTLPKVRMPKRPAAYKP